MSSSAGLSRLFGLCVALSACSLFGTGVHALDVAYSQGTVSINDSNTVTVGVGGDYATCDAAYNSFPKNGPGGVVKFLPGLHTTGCGYNLGDRGSILITGELGPNGERPRVTTPTFTRLDGSTGHEPFLSYSSNKPDILVVENLEIFDVGKGISAFDLGGLIVRNVTIDGTNGENGIKVDPTTDWQVSGPDWSTFVELYDSEVAHAGSNNSKHNVYIGRIDRVFASGLNSHSALGSHAYKSIARDNTIIDSTFAVSDLPYSEAVNSPYLSTTLIDVSACANSTITGNTMTGFKVFPEDRPGLPNAGSYGGSTISFIDVRRRKTSVGGCDDPAYGTSIAEDPQFWADAAASGYLRDNEELFHHDISGNTFINVGTRDMFIARNTGTAYMEDNANFWDAFDVDLPAPEGWFERSTVWVEDNTVIGGSASDSEDTTAPIFMLDEYDIVGIDEDTSDPGPSLGQLSDITLYTGIQENTLVQLDDITLQTASQSVPETSTLVIFGTSFVFLCMAAYRRRV